jgi:spore maturation protein CgeB
VRVLVIGERYADSFADNLLTSLVDAGHDARGVEPYRLDRTRMPRVQARARAALAAAPDLAARFQQHVLDHAEEHRPELVINLDYRVSYRLIPRLRAVADGPVVFWYPDSPGNLGREQHVLATYDALFLKDSSIVRHYRDVLGLNAFFLYEACNPRWHRPPAEVAEERDEVLVAGNVNASRYLLVKALIDRGLALTIYGPRWARWLPSDSAVRASWTGKYVTREAKARTFRSAAVVLNPLASHEGDGMNCRLFEAAACGATVLTERRDRLDELFAVPGEVRAYTSLDHLVEQAWELIAMGASARRALGDAAAARAHADHTYVHRFKSILDALGHG